MKIKFKHKNPPQPNEAGYTRAQEQARLDSDALLGRITLEEWRKKTDELSDIKTWVAGGKVKKTLPPS
jgi:hypothetical protein